MVVKIGINGFGRIGRVIFRTCFEHEDMQITAINDPAADAEYICYLIKFDSTHGQFKGDIKVEGENISVNGSSIEIYRRKYPNTVPWHQTGIDYVVEASGIFTTLKKASGHLESDTVKRVIVAAPSVDIPMIILGVNERILRSDERIISCASSTLYCLSPIIKVLENNFGIREGFVSSIHAMTPSLKPLDGLCTKGKHWRDHRSIHQNIIPATTGACKGLSKILPQLKNKLSGIAFRVPIVNVSLLDISIRLATETNLDEIMKCVKLASQNTMKNIINVSKEETVSSDFNNDHHSCTVDFTSSLELSKNFFKIICWYENEYSYASRVLDTIRYCQLNLNPPKVLAVELKNKINNNIDVKKYKIYVKDDSLNNLSKEAFSCEFKEINNNKEKSDDLLKKPVNNKFNFNAKVKYLVSKVSSSRNKLKRTDKSNDSTTADNDITIELVNTDPFKNSINDESPVTNKINATSTINDLNSEQSNNTTRECNKEQNYIENIKIGGDIYKLNSTTLNDHNQELNVNKDNIGANMKINNQQNIFNIAKVNTGNNQNIDKLENSQFINNNTAEFNVLSKITCINNNDKDIYDKLDSASGTDSQDSLELHRKRSEVINIKEVLSSLDDIRKLEQICKIIEMSDELSDKLLLPLKDSKKSGNLERWSVKQLCERINLDGFCNNIFGD